MPAAMLGSAVSAFAHPQLALAKAIQIDKPFSTGNSIPILTTSSKDIHSPTQLHSTEPRHQQEQKLQLNIGIQPTPMLESVLPSERKAEPGRETGTRIRTWSGSRKSGARTPDENKDSGVLPLGGNPRGGTRSTRETLSWNKDLNKAYSKYKEKRLRKKGKLFEEKEEASLYTGIITLLINPDNVTGKQEKQNENETREEQAKNGDRNAEEHRDREQKRGKTRIAEHTPTRNRTEAEENETGDRARTD
ncbi:hypothetical protein DFP73DRAFT_594078 [Morchella snyderi]|nr:hypothetical protein DFP73DRAFT_594078 [Morchella snyderi]